jgi:hypothetical protein
MSQLWAKGEPVSTWKTGFAQHLLVVGIFGIVMKLESNSGPKRVAIPAKTDILVA